MTATVTTIRPAPAPRDHGPELDHFYCPRCSPTRGLCGADLAGHVPAGPASQLSEPCVVCLDLEEQPCPRCGR